MAARAECKGTIESLTIKPDKEKMVLKIEIDKDAEVVGNLMRFGEETVDIRIFGSQLDLTDAAEQKAEAEPARL